MSILTRFRVINESDKSQAVEKLITDSTPNFDFFFFILLSVIMAAFGLLLDNVAVIIGSMLIAPILYPILSFGLGLVMSDFRIIYRSFYTIVKSFAVGAVAAFITTLLFAPANTEMSYEILLRIHPSLEYFLIAFIAGVAVSYSLVKPKLSSTLIGIAVSVALIPPIAVFGIGLAELNWSIVSGSFVLFIINVVGIVFAGMVTFSLMNLYVKKKVADTTVKKEEARIEHEKSRIQAEEGANETIAGSYTDRT